MGKFAFILFLTFVASPATLYAAAVPEIPFYSQFSDIEWQSWQKKSCGVASLAMVINFYEPGASSAQNLLEEGLDAEAYIKNAGWTHKGLVSLSKKYGLIGETYDFSQTTMSAAFEALKKFLDQGPIIASVHYKFDPKSTIPHLVVINMFDGKNIFYNDPAEKSGNKIISVGDFERGWKKKFIVIRPEINI